MNGNDIELNFATRAERDREYNARESVSDFDACIAEYARRAARTRKECVGVYDLHYGPGRDQRLDIFPAITRHHPAPVFVFIHGGYWRAQSKKDAPIMAPALTREGVAVCTLEYTLLPESTLFETVREVRSAIAWLYYNAGVFGIDRERIVVAGSSAGGHLAAMLAAQGWPDKYRLPEHVIKGMVGLSGLYDLQPLCDTHINEWLRLYPDQAQRLSPIHHLPRASLPVIVSAGGLETRGFKNQTQAYYQACLNHGVAIQQLPVPQCNHFDLLHELCDPAAELLQTVLALIRQV